jgi:hypothetical protein
MYCSRCGTNNREGSKFCNNCGGQLTPPDVTCPACGAVNPFKNAFCNNCGARLVPPAAPRPEPKPAVPPIKGLSLPIKTPPSLPIESPADGGDGAGEKDAEEESARESGSQETGDARETELPFGEELPDWLAQLRAAPPVEEEATPSAPVSEDVPSWIRQLQSIKPEEPTPESTPSVEEPPALPVEPKEPTGLPAWLEQPDETSWLPQQETTPPAAQVSEEPQAKVEELPQPPWEIGTPFPAEERDAAETAAIAPVDESGLPDWLQDLHPEVARAPEAPAEAPTPTTEPAVPAESGLPDWLLAGTTGEQQPNFADLPEWLRTAMPAEKPEEASSEELLAEPPAQLVFGAPHRVSAAEPIVQRAPAAAGDLEVEPEDAGTPLAGLRGVLPLAVAVAEPHMSVEKSAPGAGTEKDDGARMFEAILTEAPAEAEPLAARPAARAWTMRPVIYLLLAFAVILPFFFPRNVAQSFLRISKTPAADLYDLIQTLPSNSTVLVAFDYDPSVAGEMNLQANAIVRHLMQRRIKIVASSTYETGPQIAQKILDSAAKDAKDYGYGSEYVNAGYIPGHEVGLASLAVTGLPATKDLTGRDVRQYPMTQNIRSINDVALIVELAGSEDTLRWWMEQVQPRTRTRIVAAVSAAVEPKARVYVRPGQLAGLVSGLIGAAQYEILSNQPGQALTSVNAQCAAQVVLILIVLLGNIVHWTSRAASRGSTRARPEKAR